MDAKKQSPASVHTVPDRDGEGWANEVSGVLVSRHRTREHAVRRGRAIARRAHTEHVIHTRDGRIAEKNSYGNDPCPPRDAR